MRHRVSLLAMFAGALLATPAARATHTAATALGTSGSTNTESAVPLPPGRWAIGLRSEQQHSDRLSEAALLTLKEADPQADLHSIEAVTTTSLLGAFGVSPDLTLGFALPYVERGDVQAPHEHEGEEIELAREGDSSGLGDLKLYGLWRFFEDQASRQHVALIFGLNVPTGEDQVATAHGNELFEQEFQPGSGAWDPFAGIAYSRTLDRLGLDASLTYSLVNEGSRQTDLGDYFGYNAALGYALTAGESLGWSFVLELNGLWRDRLEADGETERNSGGHWLNLSPGVMLAGQRWAVFANIGLPIVNEPNGDQDRQDYRFLLGFRYVR